jgi:glucosamine--fructose-6-phosphate aminotransferase (isomerizing)
MCGITVIISKNKDSIIEYTLKSLSLIQNRGYDSIGIAYKNEDNSYNIIKYASENVSDSFEKIKNYFNKNNINSDIAIGHTRWATHGPKTQINSHPHISYYGNIILVHNGIINNYIELKKFLISHDFKFYSETDSEVIANLIEYNLLNEAKFDISKAIEKTNSLLEGTWALAIIYTKESENVYITRHGSPLVLGYNDSLIVTSSEINGFAGLIINYIVIENSDIIKINKLGYYTVCPKLNNYSVIKLDKKNISDKLYPYEHWTLKEIMEQPKTILAAINNGARILNNNIKLGGMENLKSILNNDFKSLKHIMLFGCGTSYFACLLSKYYFNCNITIHILDACEFCENDIPKIDHGENILSIFCSQSGETIDIIKCIEICKKHKCITFGVINVVDSLISRLVNCGIYINAGTEIAVASTKSFTNTCIILSLIALYFDDKYNNIDKINSLRLLSNIVEIMLNDNNLKSNLKNISKYIVNNNINNIFILGKNKLSAVSKEISLKMKELCYIHAEGYSSSSLKHGPFALLDKTILTILLIDYTDKDNLKNLESTYNEIISRDTNIIVFGNSNDIKERLNISENINYIKLYSLNYYNEIIFTITLQYLSYIISIDKNINPDKPRNLAKVVTVE